MPRLPRVYIENSLYYITCKSLPNQKIFKDKGDYMMYFELLKKYTEEIGVSLFAYVLMPSHMHLLCKVNEERSLSNLMHNLNSNYTKYFNSRYERKGHLFRERFRAAIVENDPELVLKLTGYMHLNPVRLKIADDEMIYPYSTCGLYDNYEQNNDHGIDLKKNISDISGILSGRSYPDFISGLSELKGFSDFHKNLQRKKIVGCDDFINKVNEQILVQQKQNAREMSGSNNNETKPVIPVIIAGVLFLLLVGAVLLNPYFSKRNNSVKNAVQEQNNPSVLQQPLSDLAKTEWEIKLFDQKDGQTRNDIISFKGGKFNSFQLSGFSFPQTNYSMSIEGEKIIWETMQTSSEGTASWRGEVINGDMSGILSLSHKNGESQVFSFKSLKWRKTVR